MNLETNNFKLIDTDLRDSKKYNDLKKIIADIKEYQKLIQDIESNPYEYSTYKSKNILNAFIECVNLLIEKLNELDLAITLYFDKKEEIYKEYDKLIKYHEITQTLYKEICLSKTRVDIDWYSKVQEFYQDSQNHLCFIGENNLLIDDCKEEQRVFSIDPNNVLSTLKSITQYDIIKLLQSKGVKPPQSNTRNLLSRISSNDCRYVFELLTSPVTGEHIVLICKIFYGDKNNKHNEYLDAYRRYNKHIGPILDLFDKSSYDKMTKEEQKKREKELSEYILKQDKKLGEFILSLQLKNKKTKQ